MVLLAVSPLDTSSERNVRADAWRPALENRLQHFVHQTASTKRMGVEFQAVNSILTT